jgi:hypothetical protein
LRAIDAGPVELVDQGAVRDVKRLRRDGLVAGGAVVGPGSIATMVIGDTARWLRGE